MLCGNQIRVIDLLPGTGDAALDCTVRIVSLDDKPHYEALSYVWGTSKKCKTIKAGDKQLPITDNLHNALFRLRRLDTVRTLWADQICIDQWNVSEKNHQVGLMRHIYRSCEHCVIWLGEFSSGSSSLTQAAIRKEAKRSATPCNSGPSL